MKVGDIEQVNRAVLLNPMVVFEINDRMETALHVAVTEQNFELVEFLLDQDTGAAMVIMKDMR